MRYCVPLFLSVAILTSSSCSRSDSDSTESAPASEGEADERGSSSADESDAGVDQDAKPIALTDARLDKYLAFRKEFNQRYAEWMKGAVDLAKSVDSKSTDISKAITAAAGAQRIGDRYEKELNALRAKHGFTAEEDERLWSAISEVIGAKVLDGAAMGDSLKLYREMQAKGGDEKKLADEVLKSFEDQEKQGLAEARQKYGDACVDVLSKRVKELSQFQADSFQEMVGEQGSETK